MGRPAAHDAPVRVAPLTPALSDAPARVHDPERAAAEAKFLAPFVSSRVAARLAQSGLPGRDAQRLHGAVLFADLSGYSRLANLLSRADGLDGVEKLTAVLNRSFGAMVESVHAHGGDVVKFAGDALICLWPVAGPDHLGPAVQQACLCALQCLTFFADANGGTSTSTHSTPRHPAARRRQSELKHRDSFVGLGVPVAATSPTPPPAASDAHGLRLHCGVGAGELLDIYCGGGHRRFEHFVGSSSLFHDISDAVDTAMPGQLVVTRDVQQLLGPLCRSSPTDRSEALHLVLEVSPGSSRALGTPREACTGTGDVGTLVAALETFVPVLVMQRARASQSEWLSELRLCSVVFVTVDGLTLEPGRSVETLHAVLDAVQGAVGTHEGTLRQALLDDKGLVVIVVFGLPPDVHENDATRAVLCAQDIDTSIDALSTGAQTLRARIGCTTGRVFCGIVGSAARKEFVVVGDAVNMAARLMSKSEGGILCDGETRQQAAGAVEFEELPPVQVKGKAEPMPVFRPEGLAADIFDADDGADAVNVEPPTCFGQQRMKEEIVRIGRVLKETEAEELSMSGSRRRMQPEILGSGAIIEEFDSFSDPKRRTPTAGLNASLGRTNKTQDGVSPLATIPSGPCPGMLIEGTAGSGKTTILRFAAATVRRQGARAVMVTAKEQCRATPLFVWRSVLASLLRVGVDSKEKIHRLIGTVLREPSVLRRKRGDSHLGGSLAAHSRYAGSRGDLSDVGSVAESAVLGSARPGSAAHPGLGVPGQRGRHGDMFAMASLLNRVVPQLELPESARVAFMDERQRSDRLMPIMRQVVAGIVRHHKLPTMLLFDDAHNMDSLSWKLLIDLGRLGLDRLSLVVAMRPRQAGLGDLVMAHAAQLMRSPWISRMSMEPLDHDDVRQMVQLAFDGADGVDDRVLDAVMARSAGNPFFATEVCAFLRSSDTVGVKQGRVGARSSTALQELQMPTSLEHVVSQKVDRLSVSAQLALKVAAVAGLEFEARVVRAVFPVDKERKQVALLLRECRDEELVAEIGESPGAYVFSTTVARDVCYGLLLVSQRRQLHGQIAQELRQGIGDPASEDPAVLAALAGHFLIAEEFEEAMRYFALAGRRSARLGAVVEAIDQLGRALELAERAELRAKLDMADLTTWLETIALAFETRGRIQDAADAYMAIFDVLEMPLPRSAGGRIRRILSNAWRQFKHRVAPGRYLGRDVSADSEAAWMLAAECHMAMLKLGALVGSRPLGAMHLLQLVNDSEERLEQSSLLTCRVYLVAGSIVAIAGLPGPARAVRRKAAALAAGRDVLGNDQRASAAVVNLAGLAVLHEYDEFLSETERLMAFTQENNMLLVQIEMVVLVYMFGLLTGNRDKAVEAGSDLIELALTTTASLIPHMWSAYVPLLLNMRFGNGTFPMDDFESLMDLSADAFDEIEVVHAGTHAVFDVIFHRASLGCHQQDPDLHLRAMRAFRSLSLPTIGVHLGVYLSATWLLRNLEVPAVAVRKEEILRDISKTLNCGQMNEIVTGLPIVGPQRQRFRAYVARARGASPRATARLLVKAIKMARAADIPFEMALSCLELSKLDGVSVEPTVQSVAGMSLADALAPLKGMERALELEEVVL